MPTKKKGTSRGVQAQPKWSEGRRPLYQEASRQPERLPSHGNAGLWYDKFCNTWRLNVSNHCWSLSAEKSDQKNPKLKWIETVAGSQCGDRDLLVEHRDRLLRFVYSRQGHYWIVTTQSRFVTGLGRPHPVENGFAWHHTLGTPYLPGSSLKGLLRAAASDLGEDRDQIDRLLGDEKRKTAGVLCFLDVIPLAPVQLEADVMTPHYANWEPADPPGDWRSPTPIPFLAVAADESLLVAVIPRGNGSSPAVSEDDWSAVERWLEYGLQILGVGAKTAVGYGRMEVDKKQTESIRQKWEKRLEEERRLRQEQERLERMDPLERELEEICRGIPGDKKAWLAWLDELEKGRWSSAAEAQRQVAERIKAEMEKEGRWRPVSRKKRPEKDRDYQRTLRVMKYLP